MNNDDQKRLDTCWKTIAKVADRLHWLSDDSKQRVASSTTTIAQTRVMIVVFDASPNGIMMKQVAQKLNLTPGAVSQTVDSLVKDGMLERYQTESDRRVIYLRLSPEGKKLYEHIEHTLSAMMHKFLSNIPLKDQETFLSVLDQIESGVSMAMEAQAKETDK